MHYYIEKCESKKESIIQLNDSGTNDDDELADYIVNSSLSI